MRLTTYYMWWWWGDRNLLSKVMVRILWLSYDDNWENLTAEDDGWRIWLQRVLVGRNWKHRVMVGRVWLTKWWLGDIAYTGWILGDFSLVVGELWPQRVRGWVTFGDYNNALWVLGDWLHKVSVGRLWLQTCVVGWTSGSWPSPAVAWCDWCRLWSTRLSAYWPASSACQWSAVSHQPPTAVAVAMCGEVLINNHFSVLKAWIIVLM